MTQPDSQDTGQQTPAIGDNSGIHGARLQSFIDRPAGAYPVPNPVPNTFVNAACHGFGGLPTASPVILSFQRAMLTPLESESLVWGKIENRWQRNQDCGKKGAF